MLIYTVTTVHAKKAIARARSRCVGYYPMFAEASRCVLNNESDIHENAYQYAVIEELGPGLYPDGSETWFSWVNGQYCPSTKPLEFAGIRNFGIG